VGLSVLVALAGGLGAALRYAVDSAVPDGGPVRVPRGTTAVNLAGSFLAGVCGGALSAGAADPAVYAVAVAGFCGGFTTFSTATLEAVLLLERGQLGRAAGYALGTLAGTVAAAAVGYAGTARLLG